MSEMKVNTKNKTITYNDIIYKFNNDQMDQIINYNKKFKLYHCDDIYVSCFSTNNRQKCLLEFLFNYKNELHEYKFINNDIYDLRPENVIVLHKYHNVIKENYNKYEYYQGHFKTNGYDSYIMKNPYWKIIEPNQEDYYVMFCEPDSLIKFSKNNLDKIHQFEKDNNNNIKLTLYKTDNNEIKTKLYNNQIINITKILNCKNKQNLDYRNDNNLNDKSHYHPYHFTIIKNYPNAIYINGHTSQKKSTEKNPYWKIKDENNEEYYFMYCETNSVCKLDEKSLNILKDFEKNNNNGNCITFHLNKNGYICSHFNNLYLHQIIMNLYGNGKGTSTVSVDHINRDKLDNRYSNLRIANFKEQQDNSSGVLEGTKRNRKQCAQDLPNNIKHEDMPKYVYYCSEKYNEKGDTRDFFRIEKHPNQKCPISTTKSMKISLAEKLNEAKEIVKKLNEDIYYSLEKEQENNKTETFLLPTGYYVSNFRNSDHLVYDYKDPQTKERKNLKMKLSDNYNLQEEYNKFLVKLYNKYPELKN